MRHSTQVTTTQAARAATPTGRRLAAGLVALGLALATFAVWFQWRQTRRCLAFYGSEAARCIQTSNRVELWEPGTGAAAERRLELGRLVPAVRTDISRARGLVHLRRGLVEDANFDWSASPTADAAGDAAGWDAALAFYASATAAEPGAVLVFDFFPSGGTLAVAGRGGRVGLGRLEKGIRTWLAAARAETDPDAAENRAF